MRTSESIAALAADLARAQAELKNATYNSTNPHFKNKYADLAQLRDCTAPILAKHGLSIVQGTTYSNEIGGPEFVLATRLLHKSGEWLESLYPIPIDKSQIMGSAITYARRYSLAAMCGIAGEPDDDGEATRMPPAMPASGSAYVGTSLVHPDTPPGKKGNGPSAYSAVNQSEIYSKRLKGFLDLDALDAWWDASYPERSKLPMGHQIDFFVGFIEHGCNIAESLGAMSEFWKGRKKELADFKAIDPTRYAALEDAKEAAKNVFAMEAG